MSKTILLFPGQGAQYVGMGQTLASTFEPARKLMMQADEILVFRSPGSWPKVPKKF